RRLPALAREGEASRRAARLPRARRRLRGPRPPREPADRLPPRAQDDDVGRDPPPPPDALRGGAGGVRDQPVEPLPGDGGDVGDARAPGAAALRGARAQGRRERRRALPGALTAQRTSHLPENVALTWIGPSALPGNAWSVPVTVPRNLPFL